MDLVFGNIFDNNFPSIHISSSPSQFFPSVADLLIGKKSAVKVASVDGFGSSKNISSAKDRVKAKNVVDSKTGSGMGD